MMEDELPPCPQGLDLRFKYDYNLERADMFPDQVGAVCVYLYDNDGLFLQRKDVNNTETDTPIRDRDFCIHFDVEPGNYRCYAVAWQRNPQEPVAAPEARYILDEPQRHDELIGDFAITLGHTPMGAEDASVEHHGLPLDTLWTGRSEEPLTVVRDEKRSYTIPVRRQTKQIAVTLRDIDNPDLMDVDQFEFSITDRNARIDWQDNVSQTTALTYTPYVTFNTTDKPVAPAGKAGEEGEGSAPIQGRTAHADFMTFRLIDHESALDDGVLSIRNCETGKEVIRVNLPDMLANGAGASDYHRYSRQEFLDRCYDYHLSFYLKGDRWVYAELRISTLSWAIRIQNEEL